MGTGRYRGRLKMKHGEGFDLPPTFSLSSGNWNGDYMRLGCVS